jgi:RNA polymerase sigma factor (TIGR02999 family)
MPSSGMRYDPVIHEGMPMEVTTILERLREGDDGASGELFDQLYPELRAMASRLFRSQRSSHTLQPTALLHEAYLKMAGPGDRAAWQDRAHFLAVAARAMRQVLVNHARDRSAQKRGGGLDRRRVTLSDAVAPGSDRAVEVLAIDDALSELAALDERQARIAELRCFGGLTNREVAEAVGVSLRTVELDWKMAKGWLAQRLS